MSRDSRVRTYGDLRARVAGLRSEVERTLGPEAPGRQALLDGLGDVERAAEALHRSAEDDLRHLAHELRTPLNAIAGWTQVLRSKSLEPAAVAESADVFERSVGALARTIETYTD